MTWGKPEAARLHFADEINAAKNTLDNVIMETKVVREDFEPKRNWRKHITSWCIISRERVSGLDHVWALQWVRGSGAPRVRVGCKYKTLAQAYRLCKSGRSGYSKRIREQGECIIRLMLLKAQYASLPGVKNIKFDSSLRNK